MQTCVLFVDDEPLILSLYEALSPDLGPNFTVRTARNGNEALKVLDETEVQIVVSDLEMPEMGGGELLTHVEKRCPDAMRVVISGYDDELHVARCLTFGHRYLRKPVEPDALASTLKRLCALRDCLADEKVKALLSSGDALPSPPETYVCLSEALQQSENSLGDFAAILESDAVLSVGLLEAANSAAFGLSVGIETIKELFEVVGVQVVRSLILSVHTRDFYRPRTHSSQLFDKLWQHGLETAAGARKLATLEKQSFRDAQTTYVAGLLHDLGQFVFAARSNDAGEGKSLAALLESEHQLFGVSHTTLGAYLLGLWGLPEPVVATAELHHDLARVPPHAYLPLVYVHAAENILQPTAESKLDLEFIARAGKAERLPIWREVLSQARS